MKKKLVSVILCAAMTATMLLGCSAGSEKSGSDSKAKGESEIILYHGNLMQYGNSHFRIAVYYCGSGADGDSDCELQGKTEKGASAAEIAEGIAELL